jgi:demethylmenaquinone methyltransferase/2-methoxy-6-polyprenyl-1,4-benzoquinol methylase
MFRHIARGYEGFDHLVSLGQDYLWRPRAFWELDRFRVGRAAPQRILDLGCGTGELSDRSARHFPAAEVVAADFTDAMLRLAAQRLGRTRAASRYRFARATARRLPFRDGSFDLVVSAFVARNLPDLPEALAEMRRMLRPGGSVLILEITGPTAPWSRALFLAYFDRVVPWLGASVGSEGPYRYLPESLRSFPPPTEVVRRLAEAGFDRPVARPQSGGIVTTFLGDLPPARHSR